MAINKSVRPHSRHHTKSSVAPRGPTGARPKVRGKAKKSATGKSQTRGK